MYKHFSFCFGLFCLLIFVVGCGDKVGLKGKVVYSDDQSPLEKGTVCLVSNKGIARGSIGANGNYVVGSIGKNDGLLPGTYRVYITDSHDWEEPQPGKITRTIERIDAKYALPETSELTVEVKSSTTYNIKVDRYKKPEKAGKKK